MKLNKVIIGLFTIVVILTIGYALYSPQENIQPDYVSPPLEIQTVNMTAEEWQNQMPNRWVWNETAKCFDGTRTLEGQTCGEIEIHLPVGNESKLYIPMNNILNTSSDLSHEMYEAWVTQDRGALCQDGYDPTETVQTFFDLNGTVVNGTIPDQIERKQY